MDALKTVTCNPEFNLVKSLPHKIVALHLVYSRCHADVLQFGQLILHRPGILQSLSSHLHMEPTETVANWVGSP